MSRLFGTDGVRGVANDALTVELAMQLGAAGAYVLTKENAHKPTILVGCDTRISGEMLSNALMAGICSVGANAIYAGVVPTPAVAYLTRKYKYDAGVVISASHNPVQDNGIKFFNSDGYKLSDELEDEIEAVIKNNMDGFIKPTGVDVGRISHKYNLVNDYINFAKESIAVDLSGIKVVVDCAEGASYITGPKTLRDLGAEVVAIHNQPDGTNINRDCGSTHMGELAKRVVAEKADLGIAFDGDADRMLAVDELGNMVDGDVIMAICANYMREKGTLKKDTIVATVMSNLGLHIMARENGINLEQTAVGDRYVLERMKEIGANIGGEQSGHIIFLDENTTGDGLISALHLLEVYKVKKKKMSELAEVMSVLPQVLINAKVPADKKNKYMEYSEITDEISRLETMFDGEGRVLIRPSGTEALVRVMIEGRDQAVIEREARRLADMITEILA